MAIVTPVRVSTPVSGSGIELWKWLNINAGDTCLPVICAPWSDKTVQLVGSFGGNMLIQGSNNPDQANAVYTTLADPQGTPLSQIAAATIETVLEHPYLIRPSPGAGVSATDVWLLMSNTKG